MADPLARWAAGRAPDLAARAEAEAVAMLRDALVRAALEERERPEKPAAPARAPAESAEPGELLWAYCVLRAADPIPPELEGVDPAHAPERVEAASLAVIVSRVPRAQFGEEPLRRNLNDLGWLERVARAHETVLDRVLAAGAIVPLRLCTLYESEDSARQMLEREREALLAALDALAGRQEWGVKVLVDPDKLMAHARDRSEQPDEPPDLTGGGAYMLRRRAERRAREVADSLAAELAGQVHARLEDWAIDAVTRPPQNRDLSGHEGDMVLNAAYLVEADRVGELRELVAELERHHRELGAHVELTGPWPPYNFVPA
jgi:hypothetical protein